MSLTKTKAWVAGTVVMCLLLCVAAWFLLISPKRAEAAGLREQTASTQEANARTRQRIAELQAEFAHIEERQAELADLRVALPTDDRLSELTRQLNEAAGSADVSLDSITPGTPEAVAPPAAATPQADTGSTADSSATAPAEPAAESTSLVRIPVTITVTGGYVESLSFLKTLQTELGRDYLAETLMIGSPEVQGNVDAETAAAQGWVTLTIQGAVFSLPEAGDVAPTSSASTTTDGSASPANN